jgi:septum formation topological specificity factor MinE
MKVLNRLFGHRKSSNVAKNRLRKTLAQDRMVSSPGRMDRMNISLTDTNHQSFTPDVPIIGATSK